MADKATWVGRPTARDHSSPYTPPKPASNPVIRGLPLYYGAELVASSNFVQGFLWKNAGFDKLRNRAELDDIDARYDPTVIRLREEPSTTAGESYSVLLDEDYESRKPTSAVFPSALDYHEAYKVGHVTPTDIAKVILPLIRRDVANATKHSTAFLDSKVDLVLAAAEQSTERYKQGKPLSPLDGVPVAVKDEEDVAGYSKNCGSKLDFTHKQDATSYCVQAWQDAGAVLVGKTNMHELGMDTTNNNPDHGTPLNPYNDRYYCGGSSGA
jgi:hypothetical protein